jgi:flagellar motor switch protein FliN/FliY
MADNEHRPEQQQDDQRPTGEQDGTPVAAEDQQNAAANTAGTQSGREAEARAERDTGQGVEVQHAEFEQLSAEPHGPGPSLALVLDIGMPVTVELGRTTMTVRQLLALRSGSVVELDTMAGDAIDLFVRDVRFARGEVVVVDNSFGLRITEIINPSGRLEELGPGHGAG